ncbi:MAG: YkgJ family cysteine cluster protein [Planctomycetes bacterium]|nr:YkgJ family cysteine cluster protein [Planctomycetota bacterium]
MHARCEKCGSRCCRYFCFQIDAPDDYEEFEKIRWYLCHAGAAVHVDNEGDWYIELENACNWLGEDGLCRDYNNRPLVCSMHSPESCEMSVKELEYQARFTEPRQIDDYARKSLGQKEYDRQKRQAAGLAGEDNKRTK